MNKTRRKELDAIHAALEELKARMETVASDERDAFDNMPEGLQQGEAGQAIETAADTLDEAASDLDDMLNKIDEVRS